MMDEGREKRSTNDKLHICFYSLGLIILLYIELVHNFRVEEWREDYDNIFGKNGRALFDQDIYLPGDIGDLAH